MEVTPSILLRGVDFNELYSIVTENKYKFHFISDKLFTSSESISRKSISYNSSDQNYILRTNDNCNLYVTNVFPKDERTCPGCGKSNLETENPTYLVKSPKYSLFGELIFQGFVPHYSFNCALYTCVNNPDIDPNFIVNLRMFHRMIYPNKKRLKICTELDSNENSDFYYPIPGVKIEKNTICWAQTQRK